MGLSKSKITSDEFTELLLSPTRWIDVRSPCEFLAGSIPGAINLPILSDEERAAVGTTYKQKGREAAIALGHELVNGETRQQRIESWLSERNSDQKVVLYCFRGGLRSKTAQAWLLEHGVDWPVVSGGIKALRRHLLLERDRVIEHLNFEIVSGPTGSGKTQYLRKSGRPFIDLEALANHRGSAFGKRPGGQPSQVTFENALAIELLRLSNVKEPILIENESRMIGRCTLPNSFFEKMQKSPKSAITLSLSERVENIFWEYVLQDFTEETFQQFTSSVNSISKKLGGVRTQAILDDLEHAKTDYTASGALDSNRVWIQKLLEWYYDPLYNKYKKTKTEPGKI